MSTSQFHAMDRGGVYRSPTMRVYHSRVVNAGGDGATGPSWLRAKRAEAYRPLQLAWRANGQATTLTLGRQLGVGPGKSSGDRGEDLDIVEGDMIRLVQAGGARPIEWFRGYVAKRRLDIRADAESFVVTAYGPELRLKGTVVTGRWHKTAGADDKEIASTLSVNDTVGANVFTSDLPVIFNESGLANASTSDWQLADDQTTARRCKVFEAPERTVVKDGTVTVQAVHWTAWSALRSLVEQFDQYHVISPHTPWDRIEAMLPATPIGEVRVEGMTLPEALAAVLAPAGFGFALEPWTVGDGADDQGLARHRLIVFPLHGGNQTRAPRLGTLGSANVAIDSVAGRRAEVQGMTFVRDAARAVNDVTVIGDQKHVQVILDFHNNAATRDLHPLWDTTMHDLADWAQDDAVDPWQWPGSGYYTFETFADKYNRSGDNHSANRHVFRSFAWNEDAVFASLIATTPDLQAYGLGAGGQYARRPRPVASTFTYDSDGLKARLHPRRVQLGIVGDEASWIDVPAEIWNDRAGFTISAGLLAGNDGDGQWYPYAGHRQFSAAYRGQHYLTLLHNTLRDAGTYKLRLRLIGSIECDRAVKGLATRGADSTWPFLAARALRMPGRFKWRTVEDTFVSGADTTAVDDAAAITQYAEQLRDQGDRCRGRGSVMLRYLTRSYAVGDAIGATAGRVVDLHVDGPAGSTCPVVTTVVWHFDSEANKTELLLDSNRKQVTQ